LPREWIADREGSVFRSKEWTFEREETSSARRNGRSNAKKRLPLEGMDVRTRRNVFRSKEWTVEREETSSVRKNGRSIAKKESSARRNKRVIAKEASSVEEDVASVAKKRLPSKKMSVSVKIVVAKCV
jgi:hypothetical protein